MPQHPTFRLHAVLLECHGRGVAVVSSAEGRHRTGDADRGKEHAGKLARPMGESKILNPWCYLAARWILDWAIELESVCTTRARISTPHPQT